MIGILAGTFAFGILTGWVLARLGAKLTVARYNRQEERKALDTRVQSYRSDEAWKAVRRAQDTIDQSLIFTDDFNRSGAGAFGPAWQQSAWRTHGGGRPLP